MAIGGLLGCVCRFLPVSLDVRLLPSTFPIRNVRGEISVRISTFKKLRRIPGVGVPFPFSIEIGRTNVKPFASLETVIKAHLRGPFEEFV